MSLETGWRATGPGGEQNWSYHPIDGSEKEGSAEEEGGLEEQVQSVRTFRTAINAFPAADEGKAQTEAIRRRIGIELRCGNDHTE